MVYIASKMVSRCCKGWERDALRGVLEDLRPVCRMSAQMAFISVGVQQEAVAEVDCEAGLRVDSVISMALLLRFRRPFGLEMGRKETRSIILKCRRSYWSSLLHSRSASFKGF